MMIAGVALALGAVVLAAAIAVICRSWRPRSRDVAWLAGTGTVPDDVQ